MFKFQVNTDSHRFEVTDASGVTRVTRNGTTVYPNLLGRLAIRTGLAICVALLLFVIAIPVVLALVLGFFSVLIAAGILVLAIPLLVLAAVFSS